jgi:predicted transcriptional regulator
MSISDAPPSAGVRAELARGGVTQADVASWLGLNQAAISKRLRGVIDWRLGELQVIAEKLGVPIARLIEEPADEPTAASA